MQTMKLSLSNEKHSSKRQGLLLLLLLLSLLLLLEVLAFIFLAMVVKPMEIETIK